MFESKEGSKNMASSPSLHKEPLVKPERLKPTPAASIPDVQPDTTLERASFSTKGIGTLFSEQVLPLLAGTKHFQLSAGSGALPAALSSFLESTEHRTLVWSYIQQCGLPLTLNAGEVRALATGLLAYLPKDKESAWPGLVELTKCVAGRSDYALYEKIGDTCRTSELPDIVVCGLALTFSSLSTHNAAQERMIQPWLELFNSRAGAPIYMAFMSEMLSRIEQGHLSSYDHLLSVLCNAQDSRAIETLAAVACPHLPPPQHALPVPSTALFAKLLFDESMRSLPAAAAGSALIWGFTLPAFVSSVIGAGLFGLASTAVRWQNISSSATESKSVSWDVISSRSFLYFAERVYEKLSLRLTLDADSSLIKPLLRAIEAHPLYAEKVADWKSASHRRA